MTNSRDVLVTFSEELNRLMQDRNVTYRQVALAARVTRTQMSRYKSGACFPDLWTLVLIADCLKCSVSELLGYSDSLPMEHRFNASELYTNEDIFADYFRDRLQQRMRSEHVNSQQLSAKSGISINHIEMYVSVHRWVPRISEFLCICSALECTPSDLLGY